MDPRRSFTAAQPRTRRARPGSDRGTGTTPEPPNRGSCPWADRDGAATYSTPSGTSTPVSRPQRPPRRPSAGCVFAEDEARLLISSAPGPSDLADMVEWRAAGEPLELVIGWAEFCGLRITVAPGSSCPAGAASSSSRRRRPSSGRERWSSTSAVARARWVQRWPRPWKASICTPPTSIRRRCGAPVTTSPPLEGRCTKAISTTPALPAQAGGRPHRERALRAHR